MTGLTGAPDWAAAWKTLFEKGDVVGIKVSPVGGRKLCSDITVLRSIFDGLKEAGVPAKDVIVFTRYREEMLRRASTSGCRRERVGMRHRRNTTSFNWIWAATTAISSWKWRLIKPGEDPNDSHFRRSYVAKVVTKQVNKIINLPVLKHHQSAGVTISLKNLSHGCVNNVVRSHLTPTLNACGSFIPSVVALPVFRQKVVLNIVDGVKASYHGGPGARPKYVWEHKTMYFGTDPVAVDKIGWKAIDAKRQEVGMAPIALSRPDKDSTFLNCQVEHIEIAGMLQLGKFADKDIDVKRVQLS